MLNEIGSTANNRRSILAIGAHPDDIELGCGGSLAGFTANGLHVRAVVLSKGRRGNVSDEDRAKETRQALQLIGIEDVHIYDFEDTQLWQHINEMVAVIEQHVREIDPYRVYSMFHEDRHQDHRAVYEASAIACRSVPQLLGYETPSSYPNFRPTLFQEIAENLETKVRALKCHKSQGTRLYMQEEKIRAAGHFRGVQVDLGPSEGFTPYRMVL